jgi:DNA-binding response OmpR family regulator
MQTLIITDNVRQGAFIQKGFQYENLSADLVRSEEVAHLHTRIPYYDGVFLLFSDVGSARQYALFCRNVKPALPLVLLTESDSMSFRALLHELNIQYFAVRPFSFRTIVSEMRNAVFQSKEKIEQSTFALRKLELDLLSHRVLCDGHEVSLRNKEFSLLHFFMMNEGKVLTRSTILEQVWDHNTDILTNTVDVHVSQLRKKILPFTDDTFIHTVPCKGYIFA